MRRVAALCLLCLVVSCAAPLYPGQRQVIFFQEWSAKLDDPAMAAIHAAADLVKQHPLTPVTVIGYADPKGSPQANIDISSARAQVVTDTLIADGVPASRITRQAKGATQYVQTSQESRRVEIVVGTP